MVLGRFRIKNKLKNAYPLKVLDFRLNHKIH